MVQVVNLHTNKVARIIGKVENTERFLRIALYQGGYSTKKVKKLPAAAANVNEQREPLTDPTLLCCAFKKHRIYLFRCISTIILLVHAVPVLILISFFFTPHVHEVQCVVSDYHLIQPTFITANFSPSSTGEVEVVQKIVMSSCTPSVLQLKC